MTMMNRRIALLSGTSPRAAALLSLGLIALALPGAAHAQNECEQVGQSPSANGTAADNYVCTAPTYPDGITYRSDGDLSVTTDLPVDPNSGQALLDVGVQGVDLIGNGDDSVLWNSTGATVTAQSGRIIDIVTQSGNIGVEVDSVNDVTFGGGTTGAIYAASEAGGSVAVRVGAAGFVDGGTGTAIEAVSSGGNGDVTVDFAGFAQIAQRGVSARASGTGAVVLNISGNIFGVGEDPTKIGVDAVSALGSMSISLIGAQLGFSGLGTALRTNSGGDATVNLEGGILFSRRTALDMTIGAESITRVTIDKNSLIRGDILAAGEGALTIESQGRVEGGTIDFTGLLGGVTLDFGETASWSVASTFRDPSGGSSEVRTLSYVLSNEGDVLTSAGNVFFGNATEMVGVSADAVLNFGGGADRFENTGFVIVNASSDPNPQPDQQDRGYAGTTILAGLESFTNSGVVLLGSRKREDPSFGTDLWYDDVLSLPGTQWIGDGGEVVMDVDLNRVQTDCTTRNAEGDLGAADCIRLVGGSTEGITNVTLIEIIPGDRGRYDPEGILLVDVAGGTSAQGHFVVGPNTADYSPAYGGSVDKGIFNAFILYDESSQQHRLVSLPGPTALQAPLLATAAQGLWRSTTGSWFDRQADLRGKQEKGLGGGVWLRIGGERVDRDALQTFAVGSQVVTTDNSYKQTNTAVNGGVDLLVGNGANSAWVVGLMGGYGRATMRFENSPNRPNFEGYTFGGYASLLSGGLFVDAAVNANILELEEDVPSLDLFPTGTLLATSVKSFGAQIEAGWRVPLTSSGLFVEPQLGLSYVRSKFDDLVVPADDPTRLGVILAFDGPTSFRGTLGGRVGIERPLGSARAELSLLGRVAKEFKGENSVVLQNRGPDVEVTDAFDGEFGEVMLSASIASANQGVSGILNLGGKFQSGYSAGSVSVGVRVKW